LGTLDEQKESIKKKIQHAKGTFPDPKENKINEAKMQRPKHRIPPLDHYTTQNIIFTPPSLPELYIQFYRNEQDIVPNPERNNCKIKCRC